MGAERMVVQQPWVVFVPDVGLDVQLLLGKWHLRCTHQAAGMIEVASGARTGCM